MVSVTIDLSGVKKKFSDAAMKQGQYALANQMLADMNQFVPMNETTLRQTATIDVNAEGINWNTPYPKAQFYGTNGIQVFENYTTPGTGPRWDLKAKSVFMSDWINAYTKGADW